MAASAPAATSIAISSEAAAPAGEASISPVLADLISSTPTSLEAEDLADVKLGADLTVNYRATPDWEIEILKLTEGRGAHFDPDVVDAFLQIHEDFRNIAKRHADTDADMQQKIEYMANAIAEVAVL